MKKHPLPAWAGCLLLIDPGWVTDVIGLALVAVVALLQFLQTKKAAASGR